LSIAGYLFCIQKSPDIHPTGTLQLRFAMQIKFSDVWTLHQARDETRTRDSLLGNTIWGVLCTFALSR